MMPVPKPQVPHTDDKDGMLTDDEQSFILDATLKPKHRTDAIVLAFIENFVRCKNIAEASQAVGIKNSVGYQLRHRSDIANAIQKIIDKSAIKYGFDASEIIERTKEIVDFDPIMVQNPDGTFKNNFHDIDPSVRRNIKKMKVKNLYVQEKDLNGIDRKIIVGEVIEYEFYDKLKAIELTGKEKELFKNTTRIEHTVTKDMASVLLAAAKRGTDASASITYKAPVTVETTSEVVDADTDEE